MHHRVKYSLWSGVLGLVVTAISVVAWQLLTQTSSQLLSQVLPSPSVSPIIISPLPSPVVAGTSSADLSHLEASDLVPVTKVVDGDTIEVLINQQKTKIRLIGVDTPEVVDPRKPVQCFGQEASQFSKSILTNQSVKLVADQTQDNKDKYDRLLRYVFLSDGSNFNLTLIKQGYAHEYTYDVPYQSQTEFKAAEKTARDAKQGLWADNVCT